MEEWRVGDFLLKNDTGESEGRGYNSDLIIVFAGGLARAVASHTQFNFNVKAFLDEPRTPEETVLGLPVIKDPLPDFMGRYVIVTGNTKRKKEIAQVLSTLYPEITFATVINYDARVSPYALIKHGTVICPNVVVDPDVRIGNHCYVDHNAVIGHSARLGDFVHIAPICMIGGSAKIGDGTFVGANTVVLPSVDIGEGCVIGAGSVVTKSVPDNSVYVGSPATHLRYNKPKWV
jgi:sugar O-acyltransferase (sialic acid O-acetyltransferase NeuD family)